MCSSSDWPRACPGTIPRIIPIQEILGLPEKSRNLRWTPGRNPLPGVILYSQDASGRDSVLEAVGGRSRCASGYVDEAVSEA